MKMRMADLGLPLAARHRGPYHEGQPQYRSTFTGTHHEPTLEQR